MKIHEVERAALSVNEFCRAAGIGRTTAYSELKSGRLHSVTCGSRRLIPASELTAWLERLSGEQRGGEHA